MIDVVLLGLKDKFGKLSVFNVEGVGRKGDNLSIPVELNVPTKLSIVDPFPFSHFSTLDYDVNTGLIGEYTPVYLYAEADLGEEEFLEMKSTGIAYHRFENREVIVRGEFFEPLTYAKTVWDIAGDKLGSYGLTTWVIHSKIHSEAEELAFKAIVEKAVKQAKAYPVDISIYGNLVEKLPYFLDLKLAGGNLTFGVYGSVRVTPEELNKLDLTNRQLYSLITEMRYNVDYSKIDNFNDKFIASLSKEELLKVSEYLLKNDFEKLVKRGVDIYPLFAAYFGSRIGSVDDLVYPYESYEAMLADENYKVSTESHSEYEGYCCEDCDGYVPDWEHEATWDVIIDERYEIYTYLMGEFRHVADSSWPELAIFTEEQLSLFREYSLGGNVREY